jgi:CheY-like chemotaxis protein
MVSDVDPAVPVFLRGDPARLRHILVNLAGNAVKFTDEGYVRIGVRAEAVENGSAGLLVEVTDSGIGIPADRVADLFQPFTQVDTRTTRRFGGTGLGLSIARHLVEMMGGEIGVESELGHGSRFWFRLGLPVGSGAAEDDAVEQSLPRLAAAVNGRAPKVLVVEDNVINQRVLLAQLARIGCHTDLATNGRECLRRLESSSGYDVVLMDCHMPEMDGYEATRAIRQSSTLGRNDIPIIAITASAMYADRSKCLDAGMDDYLPKPISANKLVEKLVQWLPAPEPG